MAFLVQTVLSRVVPRSQGSILDAIFDARRRNGGTCAFGLEELAKLP